LRRKLLIVVAVLATAFAMAVPAVGAQSDATQMAGTTKQVVKSKYDSYVVVMKADPLVVTEGKDNLDSKKAQKRASELKKSHDKALSGAGVNSSEKVNDYVNALNGFSATLSYAQAQKVANDPNVALVVPDELQQKMTDSSPSFLGLDGPAGPWQTGYDGEGVVVGIIDTGIWPEHPSFADDGTYPAPPTGTLPCEFGNTAHNPNDAPFTCNNKLIGARQMLSTYRAVIGADPDEFDSARDDDGHGTHTASTAAGNAGVEASIFGVPRGTISGIAPRAHILAYKALGNLGGFTSDLAAAIDQAVVDGVDVINYSIGGGAGLTGADDIAFLFAANAGVFVATSAGNSGPGAGTVGSPGNDPWITTVGASTQPRFFDGTVVLGNGAEYHGASITHGVGPAPLVDAADYGNELCDSTVPFTGDVTGAIVLCKRGVTARADKSLAVYNADGVGMILYNTVDTDNLFTDNHWVPSVHIDNTPGLAIKSYIASASSPTAAITNTTNVTTWESAPSMTIFSSRGPNEPALDIIKPDVTAPGLQILAGNSPFPDPGSTPPGELFQAIAGTSMSSPHVAGLFALIKQAHPDWSAAMAKSALMTTAYQDVVDNDRVSPADPFDMGAGHVDPGSKVHKGSAFQPGLVYDAGLFEYAAFTCGAELGIFTSGSCEFLDGIGVPSDPSDLNLPSIGVADLAGSQTVTRTVISVAQESGWRTYTPEIHAPAGYSVSVSPTSLKLKKGQSASYEVTITNQSAPIGEWRFGSLTWHETTGHYDVYSPIAVRAALFDAPDSVTGSGESGTASFSIKFGYTGDYEATAHGLAADVPLAGTVGQDPDQTFSVGDVGNGATEHTINVSGSSILRIALDTSDLSPTDSGIDIDLYLYKGGVEVAESTAGGTDELIELPLPDDGTYTLYVHGWQTLGGSVGYSVHTWDVPLASGGSLAISAQPGSATIGNTGTVTVAWSGLTPGSDYLGAVGHHKDGSLLGLTLVEVSP
jgi:subtilisin family serine protease